MDDAEEPAALAALTQDALQHVLGFVPVSECTTMCGVARDWRTAWRARLAAAHFVDLAGLPLDDNGLQTLLSRVASCRTLCLAECRDLSSAGITGALFHPEQPRTLRPSLSRLCSLSLRSTSIDAAAFSQVWALPGLASLDVDSCDELEESELCRQRLNGGGSMTSLSIARCSRLSGLDSLQVDPRNCTHANKWGYGFSYVYTAALVRRVPWPAIDFGEDYELVMAAKKHSMKCLAFADAVGSAVVCHITHRANTSQVLNLTHVLERPHALHCDSTRGSPEEYSFRRRFDAIFGGAPCRALVEPAIAYLAKLPPPAPPPAADEPAPDGDAESAEPSEAEARVELAANGYGHHSYNSLNDF